MYTACDGGHFVPEECVCGRRLYFARKRRSGLGPGGVIAEGDGNQRPVGAN